MFGLETDFEVGTGLGVSPGLGLGLGPEAVA